LLFKKDDNWLRYNSASSLEGKLWVKRFWMDRLSVPAGLYCTVYCCDQVIMQLVKKQKSVRRCFTFAVRMKWKLAAYGSLAGFMVLHEESWIMCNGFQFI
jgi:hypothetical protein